MSGTTPASRDQSAIDRDHLNLLSIFHFIFAGLSLLGILFVIGHYMLMSTVMSNPKFIQNQPNANFDPEKFFGILKFMYVGMSVVLISIGVTNLLSGLYIRARKHRTFSVVIACLDCIQFPFGTALGVWTLVTLLRDSVKQAYNENPQIPTPPPGVSTPPPLP